MELDRRDLCYTPDDLSLLAAFYEQLYTLEFEDPNERESFDNMKAYLRLKSQGWYGPNNYHILVIIHEQNVVAASIVDYLAEPNAGAIEFLVVHPDHRGRGLGRRLHDWTQQVLQANAERAGKGALDWIVAEMNDPFKTPKDSINPFDRALVWHAWGYEKLRFPYVQPSLGEGKSSVLNLLLMAKMLNPQLAAALPSDRVLSVLREYMRWAMRIEDPGAHPDYRAMEQYLGKTPYVFRIPLRTYIGEVEDRRVVVEEIRDPASPDLGAVGAIFAAQFRDPQTSVNPDVFRSLVQQRAERPQEYTYHLWGIRVSAEAPVQGMASFFTFPGAGFGGYVALSGSLRGNCPLASLRAKTERRMLEDDRGAKGWCIECDPRGRVAELFLRYGFHEVDVTYRQPPLPGSVGTSLAQAPILKLLYKPFGECFGLPIVRTADFLEAMEWIFRVVYGIPDVVQSEHYRDLQRQLGETGESLIPWKRRSPGTIDGRQPSSHVPRSGV